MAKRFNKGKLGLTGYREVVVVKKFGAGSLVPTLTKMLTATGLGTICIEFGGTTQIGALRPHRLVNRDHTNHLGDLDDWNGRY